VVEFPDSMSEAQVNSAAARLYSQSKASTPAQAPKSAAPAIGEAIGGIAGGLTRGTVGAAIGGAAGRGYGELAAHASEIPGAVVDVARNLISHPKATVTGAMQGMAEGAINAGISGGRQAAAQAVGQYVVGPAMQAVGSRIMQSAVKPGIKVLLRGVKSGDAVQPVVQTLLDEGVNVTPGGVAKLQSLIAASNKEIGDAVANIPGDINPLKVAGRLTDTARKFSNQVNPQADLEAISRVGENFLAHPNIPASGLSPAQTQAMKVGTYARLGGKYGQLSSAEVEAEKGLARGLKEELQDGAAKFGVDLGAKNAREGKLIDALETVGRRVAVAGNRDPVGFAWVAHTPMTFLAAIMDRSPAVKSLIARGLYNQAGKVAQVAPAMIRAAVIAVASDDPQGADAATSTGPSSPR
jgi:hypothetical protein